MVTLPFELGQDENPLDLLKDYGETVDWTTSRINDHIMLVEHTAGDRHYMIYLEWDEEFNSIDLEMVVPLDIQAKQHAQAQSLMLEINDNTWLGHFTLSDERIQPVFRYTMLLQYTPTGFIVETVTNAMDAAITECERFYSTFKLLSEGDVRTRDMLAAATMKTAGEA